MWHSEADIINDLAALNDFGEPENTEPYKILCSIGRGSKAEKKPQPQTLLDPRTGEKIELSNQCLSVNDMLCTGKGRGSALGTRSYNLLHKQLRLARPLGSGDEIFESYCKKNNSPEQVEASPDLSDHQSTNAIDKFSRSVSSSKMKSRVKAVRNSNLRSNALISSLLKAKEISGTEKSDVSNEPEILDSSNEDCTFDFQNGESPKNGISQVDSRTDNSFDMENTEDGTSKSACNSYKSGDTEKMLDKVKPMGDENCKSLSTDLSEDFNSDLSFSTEDEEVQNILKKDGDLRNISDCAGAEQNLIRNEMYRKLGERMSKMNLIKDQRKKEDFSEKNPEPEKKNCNSRDLQSYSNEFVYDEVNFPPLVQK